MKIKLKSYFLTYLLANSLFIAGIFTFQEYIRENFTVLLITNGIVWSVYSFLRLVSQYEPKS